MKDNRRLLIKKIYDTFQQELYPCFIGIPGLGKHQSIKLYAEEYHKSVEHLHTLPKDISKIYICDSLDEVFLNDLVEYLLDNDHVYQICFIYHTLPPLILAKLVSLRMKLFYAKDFLLTLSDTKALLNTKNSSEINKIYDRTLGNLYALNHIIHYDSNVLFKDAYFQVYLESCFQCLTKDEKYNLEVLSAYEEIEKDVVDKVLKIDLTTLVQKGCCIEIKDMYIVPYFIRENIHKRITNHTAIVNYFVNRKCYVKAFRYANDEEKRVLVKEHPEIIFLLSIKEIQTFENISFISEIYRLFRLHDQEQLKKILTESNDEEQRLYGSLFLQNVDIMRWIKEVKKRNYKITLPPVLFIDGFLKSQLYLGKILNENGIEEEWLSILDEDTKNLMQLYICEDALEKKQVRTVKYILEKFLSQDQDPLELKYIKEVYRIRFSMIEGYQHELTDFSQKLIKQLLERKDALTNSFKLFTLEKAIILNKKDMYSQYYIEGLYFKESMYAHLINVTILYKLKQYEKAIIYIQKYLNRYDYHSYIYSHLKYVKALCLKTLGKETQALKELLTSISYNGPLRYNTYYSYFGEDTIQLMNIYIKFIEQDHKKRRKSYKNAMDMQKYSKTNYHAYIESIIDIAKTFQSSEKEVLVNLTPQETVILKYIEEGYTNLQIAEAMQIRITTVKTHISNLYSKLNVKNRAAAVKAGKNMEILK